MTASSPRWVGLLAATAAGVVTLAGCGRVTATSPASAASTSLASGLTVRPYPAATNSAAPASSPTLTPGSATSVDAVAVTAVTAMEASDTVLDADPNNTVRRAAGWLTPGFAAAVAAYPPAAGPGAEWALWAAHRAYVQVSATLGGDDRPVDTPSAAYRQVIVVLQPVGRDGWVGPPQTQVVFVTLTPVGGQWRIAAEQTSS